MSKAIAIVLLLAAFCQAATIQPTGYYVMQAVHSQNVSDTTLSSPKLSGMHIRDEWALIEPKNNTYTFAWMDQQLQRVKNAGKMATIGIYTGNNSPAWLGVQKVGGVPIPWSPVVIAQFDEVVAQFGAHYQNEKSISAVHITSPATDDSMEMYLASGLKRTSGYSDQKILDVWKNAVDAYNNAFPNTALVLDLAPVPDSKGEITKAVAAYARQQIGERLNVITCNLKAGTDVTAPHMRIIGDLQKQGYRVGFEMVGPSNTARFGGSFSKALSIGSSFGAQWYQIYQNDIKYLPNGVAAAVSRGSLVAPLTIALNTAVPEPSTALLLLPCLFAVSRIRRFTNPMKIAA